MSEYNIQMNKYNALNAGYDQLYPQPMKHANTHAKDGSDPITPASIGAYTKTETDTLLQNNDPRNWGLGSTVAPKVTDLNTVFSNGWYRTSDGDTVNFPTTSDGQNYKYGWLFVTTGFYTRQDYYTNTIAPMHFIRYYVDGNWSPWDIENPPMILGVEYRTTERYRGKPVYQKLIDFGALPNNTQKDVSIFASGETNTMECGIDVKLISHSNQAYKTLTTLTTQVLQNGGVTVKTNYNNSATSVYALCYYTKTTD